jgi:hypothetical protein
MIWKIWQKSKLKCEKIWKIWKKSKLNSVKIKGKYSRKERISTTTTTKTNNLGKINLK